MQRPKLTKEEYIAKMFRAIRRKKLIEPIQLNEATVVPDLERYLRTIENAILNNNSPKILRLFINQLETLLKLKQ